MQHNDVERVEILKMSLKDEVFLNQFWVFKCAIWLQSNMSFCKKIQYEVANGN